MKPRKPHLPLPNDPPKRPWLGILIAFTPGALLLAWATWYWCRHGN